MRSTRPGVWLLNVQSVSSIIANPTTTPILTSPARTSPPNPAFTMAAPAKPPMSACDELVGSPQYQVMRSQTIAPMSPARITHWSTTLVSTTPLPTVRATPTPKPKAATKLKNAAHTTAWSGVSTRVETTVAIELAASWKPLMKSKTSATKMMKTTAVSTEGRAIGSRHLEDDPLDDVRHVLAAVGDGLHRLVDLLPLDHLDGVALLLEHRGEGLAQQGVGAVLQAVHLHRVLVEARVHRAQAPDAAVHRRDLGHDHVGHRPARRGRLFNPVDDEALGGRLEEVEHVVEAGREVVDVLAVDRRDEGRVEPPDDLVGDLVARVFDFLDGVGLGPGVGEGVDQLVEEAGGPNDVLGLLLEVIKEPHFPRDQVGQAEHGFIAQCIMPSAARAQEAGGARGARAPRAPR